MLRALILSSALMVAPAVAQAQTFAQLAVDTNNPPPALANPYGPQPWVDDGLIYANEVQAGGNHTTSEAITAGDDVGAFRMTCTGSWLRTDDPVVYPGQPYRSHLHQGYGNDSVTAFTTYQTLRQNGKSSCQGNLNRSGYWQPGLLTGKNLVLRPDSVAIYYKGYPKNSPQCTPGNALYVGRCVGIPNALRMIFGYDMLSGTIPTGQLDWACFYKDSANAGVFTNIPDAMKSCATLQGTAADWKLRASIRAQACWDGMNLDSPNHRSHTSDFLIDPNSGRPACPKTHPYAMPHFTASSFWQLDSSMDFSGVWSAGKPNQLHLSSDSMPGMAEKKPGTTLHFDYFEGWNLRAKMAWQDNCVDRGLNCAGGDLGNGEALKPDPAYPNIFVANPRLVKRPKMANEATTIHIHAPQ